MLPALNDRFAIPPAPGLYRIEADGLADGFGLDQSGGGAVLLERRGDGGLLVRSAGPVEAVRGAGKADGVIDRAGCVLLPGLVNAHTHLDLTHIGPRPYDSAAGFGGWIGMIRGERRTEAAGISASVREGVELAIKGGTVLVGDIAGGIAGRASGLATLALEEACRDTGLHAVSYVEFFAQGARWPEVVEKTWALVQELQAACEPGGRVVVGVQPHAPYSVALPAYQRLLELAGGRVPVCTHLAESAAEAEFVARASGPLRELLESVGVWDEVTAATIGHGRSPVQHLAVLLKKRLAERMGVVHVNQMDDDDAESLNRARTPVAYCPRASAYFGAEKVFGPHRYQWVLDQVGLGTDSAVNIAPEDLAEGGLSVLDEARLLWRRDGLDPVAALRAATVGGERFLFGQVRPSQLRLEGGVDLLGLTAVEVSGTSGAAARVMGSDSRAEVLAMGRLWEANAGARPIG